VSRPRFIPWRIGHFGGLQAGFSLQRWIDRADLALFRWCLRTLYASDATSDPGARGAPPPSRR
jgi:hypothetical protein